MLHTVRICHLYLRKFLTDRIGTVQRILLLAIAKDEDKFLTTVTGCKIFFAAIVFENIGKL